MGIDPNKPNAAPAPGENITTGESEPTFKSWEEHQKELGIAEAVKESEPAPIDAPSKEEQLATLLSQAKELATSTENAAEEESSELVEFGAAKIPRELLGEEKVVISELKDRSKLDVFGRRKDKETLQRLLYDDDYTEEDFKKLFTPTVAKLFLDGLDQPDNVDCLLRGIPPGRLLEALPLENQLSVLSKKENINYIVSHSASRAEDELVNKSACGLLNNLTKSNDERISAKGLERVIQRQHDERRVVFGGAPLAERLDPKISSQLFEVASNDNGYSKLDCAMAFLSGKELFDNIDHIFDRPVSVADACIFNQVIESNTVGVEENEEWRAKYDTHFSPEIRKLVELGGLAYADITEEEQAAVLKELEDTKELRGEIGLDDKSWDTLRRSSPRLYEQIKASQQLDAKTKENIKLFAESGLVGWCGDRIDVLEALDDVDKIYLEMSREAIEKEQYSTAREFIGYYALGMGTDEAARGLISVGAIETHRPRGYSTNGPIFYGVDKIKLKDTSAFGELSEDQKLLILDAISLFGCKDEELGEKLEVYEKNHVSSSEKKKFKDLMSEAKERMSEKVSKIYGERMQQSIQAGTRKVGDIVGESGEQIPVLEMEGKDFLLLVHRLGAFIKKDREDPAQWNNDEHLSNTQKEIGYISTTLIANGALRLANILPEELGDQDEVFYGFSRLGDKSIKAMCTTDSYTKVREVRRGYEKTPEITTAVQDVFYEDPEQLIKQNEKDTKQNRANYRHNEVALDRYSGNPNERDGRLQPSEIIVFTDNQSKIGDLPKKHAAYFGVPIIMIDPNKYK